MIRRVSVSLLTALSLVACGGGDGPSAPTPTAVRVTASSFGASSASLTMRNGGGAGQMRVVLFEAVSAGCFILPNGARECSPVGARLLCTSDARIVNAGWSQSLAASCPNGRTPDFAVVEVQDGSNASWVRTACVARADACPAEIRATR